MAQVLGDDIATLDEFVRGALADLVDDAVLDDLTQDVLTRLLAARDRLDPATLSAYAWVVARNVGRTHRRDEQARQRALTTVAGQRAVAGIAVEDPAERVAPQEREALRRAFARLSERDRQLLAARDVLGEAGPDTAAALEVTPSTLRVALLRARARLRVRYELERRGLQPVSERCLPVLDAIAARARTSQTHLEAGAHVVACPTCAAVVDTVVERRPSFVVVPLGLAAVLRQAIRRAGTTTKAVAGGATAAAAVAAAVALAGGDDPPPPAAAPAPTSTAPAPAPAPAPPPPAPLRTDAGEPLLPAPPDLAALVGRGVVADGVPVRAVVGDEAFWVGTSAGDEVLVVLVGTAESAPQVQTGQSASFAGTLVAHDAGFGALVGVGPEDGADLLAAQGAHVEVPVASLAVA